MTRAARLPALTVEELSELLAAINVRQAQMHEPVGTYVVQLPEHERYERLGILRLLEMTVAKALAGMGD